MGFPPSLVKCDDAWNWKKCTCTHPRCIGSRLTGGYTSGCLSCSSGLPGKDVSLRVLKSLAVPFPMLLYISSLSHASILKSMLLSQLHKCYWLYWEVHLLMVLKKYLVVHAWDSATVLQSTEVWVKLVMLCWKVQVQKCITITMGFLSSVTVRNSLLLLKNHQCLYYVQECAILIQCAFIKTI